MCGASITEFPVLANSLKYSSRLRLYRRVSLPVRAPFICFGQGEATARGLEKRFGSKCIIIFAIGM